MYVLTFLKQYNIINQFDLGVQLAVPESTLVFRYIIVWMMYNVLMCSSIIKF